MLTTCFRWIVLWRQRRAKVKSESSPYKRKNERRETEKLHAAKLHPALVILHPRLISLIISVCSTTSNPYGAILV